MKRILFLVFAAILVSFAVRTYIIEGIYVASASMESTLLKDEKYFLEKVTINFNKLKRGAIVVFASPLNDSRDLIKRVIALPGETIEIKNKIVFINEVKLNEDYVKFTRKNELLKGDNIGPIVVPENSVFVMGDNRDESGDSRDWKNKDTGESIYFVKLNKIKGKIILFY